MATLAFKAEGEAILLVGAPPSWGTHLGQSIYLREILGREDGPPPPVDLAHEKRVGDFVRGLIRDGCVTAVHDLSDGGLAVALAEMAMASGIGATVNAARTTPRRSPSSSARTRAATSSPPGATTSTTFWTAPRRPASSCPGSATPAAPI